MVEELTSDQIVAMPYARFGKVGPGDFIEMAGGLWQEILYITWRKEIRRWSVTTVDKRERHILIPDLFRYKINPFKPEGPAVM